MTEKEITDLVRKHSAKPLFGVVITLSLSILLLGGQLSSPFMFVSVFILSVGSCMYIIRKVLIDIFTNLNQEKAQNKLS